MTEFTSALPLADLPVGARRSVWVQGRRILLYNVDGTIYATDEQCTHRECSLEHGTLSGTVVTCPCHRARFDITTGEVLSPPATIPLPTYPVKVEGGQILVAVEPELL